MAEDARVLIDRKQLIRPELAFIDTAGTHRDLQRLSGERAREEERIRAMLADSLQAAQQDRDAAAMVIEPLELGADAGSDRRAARVCGALHSSRSCSRARSRGRG